MSIREYLSQEIANLNEAELQQVADYVAFLKFRARSHKATNLDEAKLAELYAEFAEEDRQLAEEGMADYTNGLFTEDRL